MNKIITTNSYLNKSGGVSEMIENIIQEYKENYIALLNDYKCNSKNNKLNSRFLSNRPWIKLDESTIDIHIEYLKQGMDIEVLRNVFERVKDYISNEKGFKYPVLLKKIEDSMFDLIPKSFQPNNNKDDNFIISLNNGELNLMVRGLNSVKATSIETFGNKITGTERTQIISEMENDFNGIKVKLVHTNLLPYRVDIDNDSKEKSLAEFSAKFANMDADVQQMWRIVVARFITLASENRLENGCAYISMEDIYFNYKKGKGSGEYGTSVPLKVRKEYMNCFRELEKYTVNIDYSNTSNRLSRYMNIKKNNKIINNSSLFKIVDILSDKTIDKNSDGKIIVDNNNDKVVGIVYQLGAIGKIYIEDLSISQLNYKYSKDLLSLHSHNNKVAYYIGDYLEYEHRNKLYKKDKELKFSLAKLIQISNVQDFKFDRFKRSMEALLKQLDLAAQVLIDNGKIESIDYPKIIIPSYKNKIDYIFITVKFKYSQNDVDMTSEKED